MLGIVHWVIKVSTIISSGTLSMLAGKGCCFASLGADDEEDDDGEA